MHALLDVVDLMGLCLYAESLQGLLVMVELNIAELLFIKNIDNPIDNFIGNPEFNRN